MTVGDVYKSEPMLYVFGTNNPFGKRSNNCFFIQPVNFRVFFSPKRIFIYFCACQSERKRVGQRKRILRFVPQR